MPRRVILALPAQNDQQRIRIWFRQPGSGPAVRNRLARLEPSIAAPAVFPMTNGPGLIPARVPISQGHQIIHEVEPKSSGRPEGDVLVLRIIGPGQSDT